MPSKVAQSKSYYDQGSTELAVASRLTLKKLERRRELTHIEQKTVIVLVGLPGRGKSFIGRKLLSFLTWRGVPCRVFNVGQYRRRTEAGSTGTANANFFDASNTEAARLREDIAMMALQDLLHWLARDNNDDNDVEEEPEENCNEAPVLQGGDSSNDFAAALASEQRRSSMITHYTSSRSRSRVAIFDATNSTKARRDAILETCATFQRERRMPNAIGVVFVESVCDDQEILDDNFRYKISTSPDFQGVSPAEALDDLRSRAQKYEDRYETIQDDSLSYIKIFNFSSKLMANQIYGRVSKVIVPALMAWHIGNRPIYLCRAGKTFGDDECDDCNDNGEQPQQRSLLRTTSRNSVGCDQDPMDASAHSQNSYASSITATSSIGKRSVQLQQANLGMRGRRFRDALSDYITQEGVDFMRQVARAKGQSPLKKGSSVSSLMTGTSVTGKATLMTGVPAPVEDDARCAGSDEKKAEEAKEADAFVPSFPCFVMTSTMPRAIQTASTLPFDINEYSHLNPLDKGDFIGMDLDEIMANEPGWYEQLQKDPFRTRFPGGECYQDLVNRLETTIIDMEQQVAPVLVVSHVSVIQCLLAYFRGSPVECCTTIEVPTHTVFKLTPLRGGGWRETLHHLRTDESSDGSGTDSEADDAEELQKPIWGDTFRVVNSYEE